MVSANLVKVITLSILLLKITMQIELFVLGSSIKKQVIVDYMINQGLEKRVDHEITYLKNIKEEDFETRKESIENYVTRAKNLIEKLPETHKYYSKSIDVWNRLFGHLSGKAYFDVFKSFLKYILLKNEYEEIQENLKFKFSLIDIDVDIMQLNLDLNDRRNLSNNLGTFAPEMIDNKLIDFVNLPKDVMYKRFETYNAQTRTNIERKYILDKLEKEQEVNCRIWKDQSVKYFEEMKSISIILLNPDCSIDDTELSVYERSDGKWVENKDYIRNGQQYFVKGFFKDEFSFNMKNFRVTSCKIELQKENINIGNVTVILELTSI